MAWIDDVRSLLNQSRVEEAMAMIKNKAGDENEMAALLIANFDQRLNNSILNFEKGKKLMADSLVEKFTVQIELKRLLVAIETQSFNLNQPGILFLSAKPAGMNHLKIDSEFVKISECIQEGKIDFKLSIKSNVKVADFTEHLMHHAPKYLHFSGHGVTEVLNFNNAGIVFEASNMDPAVATNDAVYEVIKLVTATIALKGVILNACHSHALAKKVSELGIHVIGMLDEIQDDSAVAFSQGFYTNFGILQEDFEQAFGFGVSYIKLLELPNSDVPALYFSGAQIN